jgi:hypothetical protein
MVETVVAGMARQEQFVPLALHVLEATPATANARLPRR